MRHPILATKRFVQRNKNAILVGAIAGTVIVLQGKGIQQMNAFLKEKDLFDEYYHTS